MKKFTIKENGQAVATACCPENWSEIPLSTFLEYDRVSEQPFTPPHVLTLLSGVPLEILLADISLCVPLWKATDWMGQGLPSELELRDWFDLDGVRYEHVGTMQRLTAGQFESLGDFLREHAEQPIQSAPSLLAILYRAEGTTQTRESVAAAAKAFRALPMAIAYPALADFLRSGASVAASFRTYSEVAPKAAQLLSTLEARLLSSGACSSFLRRWQHSLLRTWIRSARAQF